MTDAALLHKSPGELKEAHEARLATAALPLFDIDAYVEDFGRSVVPAYRRGVADAELPAEAGLARSIIPPGTAAVRDFSHLAPRIPEFLLDRCVGCMACVSACPDSAIMGIVVPEAELGGRIDAFAAGQPEPDAAAGTLKRRFATTQKYGDVPAKKGIERGAFGIFVDPVHCKGCGECVEVCAALGHDALVMIDKVGHEVSTSPGTTSPGRPSPGTASPGSPIPGPMSGSTLERYARDMAFFRSLPPTPEVYRNDKALADLMLGEHAFGYVGGAGSCSGCGEGTALRMLVGATRQIHGPESMGIVAATGCNTVFGSTYPFNPYLVPWTNSLFENAPAVALGVRARWDASGHPERRLWVLGGDGAMYDIGFQSLSRMVASGADIKVMVLDTQVYSNTGGQASTASFGGQITKLSAFGKAIHGRPERRKELGRILMAHGETYVAQTTPAHLNHFYRAVMDANTYPGPAVIVVYTPCMPEHGIADDAATRQAKLAVDSRAFPLFTYDPRRGASLADRLSLQGNPALRADWASAPDGKVIDFLAFARTEGRFSAHFGRDGSVTPEIEATQADRLANWRTLQELAGLDRGQALARPPGG
ncbi:MAG TPA: thiamine pyrophosphate-dependent enzyme [Candidatus Limnocylindrales bacterium]|jgi:pyruvate/2-oxoacid:ferredoxin oxidoreductase beta subunit/Pyruvate/2-oxoacid:ferredoxin oxidoreductase delta subunit